MPGVECQPIQLLLQKQACIGRGSAADATHRRALSESSLRRIPFNAKSYAKTGIQNQPQKSAAPDAAHGPGGHLSEAQDQSAASAAQSIPLSAQGTYDRSPQPGVDGRYNLHSDEPWVHVSGGGHGLAQPQGFSLAAFQYPGTDFCVEAVGEAISRHGRPQIFNTDQGAQFTASAFTDVLSSHDVRISMDGRGRVQDNIFIERLWWTLKYQYLYL